MLRELQQSQSLEICLVRVTPEQLDAIRRDVFRYKDKAARSVFDCLPTVHAGELGISECVVCQEDLDPQEPLTQLPCKHAFCTPCISRWLLDCKNGCPLCARPITEENVQACTTSVDKDALSLEPNFDLDNADAETPHAASLRGLDADGKRFSVSRRAGFGPGMSCCLYI